MTRFSVLLFLLLSGLSLLTGGDAGARESGSDPYWGFFGHRRINRLATFTLPPEMMPLFRGNLDYLSEHAVDPDKRRYATENEAVRHYIDLDHWGQLPFENVPRTYVDALINYAGINTSTESDTLHWRYDTTIYDRVLLTSSQTTIDLDRSDLRNLYYRTLLPAGYREVAISPDSLTSIGFPPEIREVTLVDTFSSYGILPYHLANYHRRLTDAFVRMDPSDILRLAAEMGHYVADAHVPLHTTENYNGQLTGQDGIHAFWESRLPELFADAEYDFLVGPAEYIEDPQAYYWDIVLHSHSLVDSVLTTERRLRESFPSSQQRCVEERLGRMVSTECTEYARAWSEAMDGMVEDQFRASIHAVGSVWYSCWVDAGQPDLAGLLDSPLTSSVDSILIGVPATRPHD